MPRAALAWPVVVLAVAAALVAWGVGAFEGLGGDGTETVGVGGASDLGGAETSETEPGPTGVQGDGDEPAPLDPLAADVAGSSGGSGIGASAAGRRGDAGGGVDVTADGSTGDGVDRRGGVTGSAGSGKDRAAGKAGATNPAGTKEGEIEVPTGTISGRVVRRSDGLVIAGAQVRAFPHNRGPARSKWSGVATEDGTFVIEAVPVGRYGIEATFGGHSPEVVAGIEVTADTDTPLGDLVLANGALLQGVVAGADGQPREGLTIRVWAAQTGVTEVQTAENGSYRTAGLAPGNYFVEIRGATAPDRFPVRIVTLTLGEARVLDFKTTPGVALTVTVLRGGEPLPSAEVRVVTRAGTCGDVGLKLDDIETDVVKTDDVGQVRFADLAPGPYDLMVRHRDTNEAGKGIGPWHSTHHSFVIPEDGTTSAVVEVRYPSAEVHGVVLDAATGTPIRGARIALESAALRTSRSLADKLISVGTSYTSSNAKGEFTLWHVEPGAYSLAVIKNGFAARTFTDVNVGTTGISDMRIELTAGEAVLALTVQVGEERAVQGSFAVVRDAAGADVGLHGIPIEGTVEFKGLAAGVHTLLLYVPNEAVIVRTDIVLVAGETTALTVVVPK